MGAANEYLRFDQQQQTRKTKIWEVVATLSEDRLGCIRWRSGWRKYVFSPAPHTDYEQDCLRIIADFIEQETAKQKATWKKPPKEINR